ncbi:MAG: radical SAM protein [Desulfovibrionaceae bacterium]
MDNKIIVEISGLCNAKCPWCHAGRANRNGAQPATRRFMPPEFFDQVLTRLRALGLMANPLIEVFNYGEPLLHPHFADMAAVLAAHHARFRISTNGSRLPELPPRSMAGLETVVFSMPGFSQASYDRGHGFRFETILRNILALRERLAGAGFTGQAILAYHVYQHNLHEIGAAGRFCTEHGMHFFPYFAHMVDLKEGMAYLNGALDQATLTRASQSLMLSHVPGLAASQPGDWHCFQQNKMIVDEFGMVVTCCLLDKAHPDYAIGSLFDLSLEEIVARKKSRPVCGPCLASGAGYWYLHPTTPPFVRIPRS